MLSTLIYRSHICDDVPFADIQAVVDKANHFNRSLNVTGILLFNGTHFFQLLEGPEDGVQSAFRRVCADTRHHNIVELLRDYAPARRFGKLGMELFDLRKYDQSSVLQAVLDRGTSKYQLTWNDRALQFLRTFVSATERENYFEIPDADSWEFISEPDRAPAPSDTSGHPGVLLQPLVDPLVRELLAVEATAPDAEDSTDAAPQTVFQQELATIRQAFSLSRQLGLGQQTLAINLSPHSLTAVPDATAQLLATIHAAGLLPEQIVVEITENEIATSAVHFRIAIRQLKAAGISLAIDNFGSGYGGLLTLIHLQPDRIKIDRTIISNIHRSGPKQAVVQGLIKCCAALEISVVATGVEQPEEWMWLESAGINIFQGNLFAAARENALASVRWPELKA